jgi:glyoxylase-like metal-dependent hydrolase (beta-lactamase superfamily II)
MAGRSCGKTDEIMRRFNLSDGVLFSLTDAAPAPAPWSYAFPDANPADRPSVSARWLPDDQFHTRFSVTAFQRRGQVVIVDAGLGAAPSPYFNGLAGRLDDEMKAAGLDVSAVSHVLFTHFHIDHVGWATNDAGDPYFPNARYHAPAAELEHWRTYGEAAALPHHVQAFDKHLRPLLDSGQLDSAEAVAILDGARIAYRSVPGHTRGHSAVYIETGDQTILVAGDTWHSAAQIAVPRWCHRADRDRITARLSRRALSEWAFAKKAIVIAGHFPEALAFGHIERDRSDHFTFVPLEDTRDVV